MNTICEGRNSIVHDGITRAQKAQLTERIRSRMDLKHQWFSIFNILFPDHIPRPTSAFLDTNLAADLLAFQNMMLTGGPNIILSTLEAHNTMLSTVENEEQTQSDLYQAV
jgi:hypothetical protein